MYQPLGILHGDLLDWEIQLPVSNICKKNQSFAFERAKNNQEEELGSDSDIEMNPNTKT